MSEKENIEERNPKKEISKSEEVNENISPPKAIQQSETQISTSNTITSDIQNMQTHAHELHKKPSHGWKHYFFEFFMLFLAVTLGYFVENIREHFNNKQTEKQNIESLVKCLASDTVQLQNFIKANKKVIGHLDSLVQLRNADLSIKENKKNFLRHAVVGFSEDWYFTTNDAALQQLKSSGTLRLIHKQNIIDSIFKYDLKNKALVSQQADCYFTFKESFADYKRAIGLFFYRDTTVMKYSLGYDNSDIEFKNIDAVSISTNKEQVNILFGDAALMAAPDEAYINLMQDQLDYGKSLITFLKKEYDIKDD